MPRKWRQPLYDTDVYQQDVPEQVLGKPVICKQWALTAPHESIVVS